MEAMAVSYTHLIKGYALDSTDKKISGAPIVWESRLDEEDGIKLENNQLSFTKGGTFRCV